MSFILIIPFFLAFVSTERALPSYVKDVGQAPIWLKTPTEKTNAAVERWYIDVSDATCKPFTYLGSLGNFNNFVSRAACNEHLKFKPEEQANACGLPKAEGSCSLSGKNMLTRWYFKTGNENGKTNSCHIFKYNGCGGNANNFDSQLDCERACRNNVNGGMERNSALNTMTATPNDFDCKFIPEVKTATPIMGIVPHKDGKKCVYAAVGSDLKRGYFEDLPTCVDICIKTPVEACGSDVPYQVTSTTSITDGVSLYYYFNKQKKQCLPFMSKTIVASTTQIDDGALNIFSSVELCASFCPASMKLVDHTIDNSKNIAGQIGPLTADEPCKLKESGKSSDTDTYQIPRYYYDHEEKGTNVEKCKQFTFNGRDMNLNNFKDKDDCDKICKDPLTGSE